MSVDAQRAYLKKEDVYDHLGKIIDRVIAEKPTDAYGLVEVVSRLVKEPPTELATPEIVPEEAITEYVKKARDLDAVPSDEDGTQIPICAIPDFMEDAEMFSWAGVGFGKLESYKVMCSLRKLAAQEKDAGFIKLRFWGKILGTERDYFIAEVQRDGGGDDPEADDPDAEPAGSGANQYTFYATSDLRDNWHRLPDIKPSAIISARMIKRLVTGNLKAKVISHPFFDGLEELLLRAQIARINADTLLCVKGRLTKEEEDSPIEENQEFQCPPVNELLKKENWTHMQPHILRNGRTTHKELPDEDEFPEEAATAKEEQEADPVREVLRTIDKDDLKWAIKQMGDLALYRSSGEGPPKSNAVTCVKSLTWPGAVCVARGNQSANIYVGYGIAAREPDFFLPAPPDVQDEPDDPGECPEPQGTEEPEEKDDAA